MQRAVTAAPGGLLAPPYKFSVLATSNMEKLKNILSPGHKKDDDQLYGNDQSTADPTSHSTTHGNTSTSNTGASNTGTLSGQGSHFGSTKEHREPIVGGSHSQTSDLNPRVNPGNDKYDETRYGPGGTATTGHTTDLPDRTAGTIHSHPAAEKDDGIARQILNPGGHKYDDVRYGTTGTVEPTSHSRVNEPHGTHGTAATAGLTGAGAGAAAGAHHSGKSTPLADDGATIASVKDGVIGEKPHSKSLADSASPVRRDEPGTANVIGSGTERSFPLSGSQTTHGQHHGTHDSTLGTQSQHHGLNDGREGLAGAAGAATALPGQIGHEPGHDHAGHGHQFHGPNTSGSHGGSGPHATQTANMLDPSIGGTGHGKTAGYDGSSDPSSQHHYGRDAAMAGGATAAAGGLYEVHNKGSTPSDPASKTVGPHSSNLANIADPRVLPDAQKMKSHEAQSTATDPASMTTGPHQSNMANVADPRVLPEPEKMKGHTTLGPHQSDSLNRADPRVDSDASKLENQHHYGRDAALAGGAGAGAAGAYEAAKHHNDNPYASKGIDPRVDPSGGTSAGDHYNHPGSTVGGGAGTATGIDYNKHDNEKLEKERSKTEKKHEKEMEKHEKEAEKAEKKHEKEVEKEQKKEDKKHSGGGLISSLLHRGDRKSSADEGHKSVGEGVNPGAYPTSTEEELGKHHHNKLHKDPPAGYAGAGTGAQSGYPDATSTQHLHDSTTSSGLGNRDSGVVIDPQSGLPMDTGKYGSRDVMSGHGGQQTGTAHGATGTHGTTGAPYDPAGDGVVGSAAHGTTGSGTY
ncbi:hypothetical protein K490DRAFT_67783 [Saccharata proteae CBS 121410]|uniref:Uncharacterized protein n=1 Tax=Saccharata proteae CBS 121410 TaxID=1314787 RepID=A0A9P4LWR5_9PEZI|nr:hypothetical protein K490DRAFT_67783 [Saccharata proteae CBS 121410]